jgi:hypothetical protein
MGGRRRVSRLYLQKYFLDCTTALPTATNIRYSLKARRKGAPEKWLVYAA